MNDIPKSGASPEPQENSNTSNGSVVKTEEELNKARILEAKQIASTRISERLSHQFGNKEKSSYLLEKIRSRSSAITYIQAQINEIGIVNELLSAKVIQELSEEISFVIKKTIALHDRNRKQIDFEISREYDLRKDQQLKVSHYLDSIEGMKLANFKNTKKRAEIIKILFKKSVRPPLKLQTQRMEEVFGLEWTNELTTFEREELLKIFVRPVSNSTLKEAFNILKTEDSKARLAGEIFAGLSIAEVLNGLNFSNGKQKTKIEKIVLQEARDEFSKKLEKEEMLLPIIERRSAGEIKKIVNSLSINDIGNTRPSSETLINIFSDRKNNQQYISAELVDSYTRNLQEKNEEVKIVQQDFNTEIEAPNNPTEAYEKAIKFDKWTIEKMKKSLKKSQIIEQGFENLLLEEFQSGSQTIFLTQKYKDGSEDYLQISADRQGLSIDNAAPVAARVRMIGYKPVDKDPRMAKSDRINYLGSDTFFAFTNLEGIEKMTINTKKDFLESSEKVSPGITNKYNELQLDIFPGIALGENGVSTDKIIDYNNLAGAMQDTKQETERIDLENTVSETPETVAIPEADPEDFITDLITFQTRVSSLLKKTLKIEIGALMSIHTPESKNYNIFRINKIDPKLGIQFTNGEGEFDPIDAEYWDFNTLFTRIFDNRKVGGDFIDGPANGLADVLRIAQDNGKQGEAWKNTEVKSDGDGGEYFDFIDRRIEESTTDPKKIEELKKRYFIAPNGQILQIERGENNIIIARMGKNFKDEETDISGNVTQERSADWFEEPKIYSAQSIAAFIIRNGATPWNRPHREIASQDVNTKIKPGTLRGIMGRYSIRDIMSGGKKFIEEFKHHLEHGNHLQEQRIMLGIAERMGMKGWNVEWYHDFKFKYEVEEKKLIEARIETLAKMNTRDRHASIRNSLLTNTTHDYDHWTNAISMIQKHGQLYAGGLKEFEGQWLFFRRIAGIPLKGDINQYSAFQEVVAKIRNKGIDNITEEAVIEEYMKTDPHFKNSQIWKMVKNGIRTGYEEEITNGEKEAELFSTLDQRMKYAMGKLRDKEYAHGIGAFKKALELQGDAQKKHAFAFALAMSRIPERLPRNILEKFVDLYDKEGYIHSPALMYIKDRSSQGHFRDTVKSLMFIQEERVRKISSVKADIIKKDTENLDAIIAESAGVTAFDELEKFWKKYGSYLHNELTVSDRKDKVMMSKSVRTKHPQLEKHYTRLESQLADADIMKDINSATPFMETEGGASPIFVNPSKVIEKIGLFNDYGRTNSDPLSRAFQNDFIDTMTRLGSMEVENLDDMSQENRAKMKELDDDKKTNFQKVYEAFSTKMQGAGNITTLYQNPVMRELRDMGFEPPPAMGKKAKEEAEKPLRIKKQELDMRVIDLEAQKAIFIADQKSKKTIVTQNEHIKLRTIEKGLSDVKYELGEVVNKLRSISETANNGVGRFNMSDLEHIVHFENCYTKFLAKTRSVNGVLNMTEKGVNDIMTQREREEVSGIDAGAIYESGEYT